MQYSLVYKVSGSGDPWLLVSSQSLSRPAMMPALVCVSVSVCCCPSRSRRAREAAGVAAAAAAEGVYRGLVRSSGRVGRPGPLMEGGYHRLAGARSAGFWRGWVWVSGRPSAPEQWSFLSRGSWGACRHSRWSFRDDKKTKRQVGQARRSISQPTKMGAVESGGIDRIYALGICMAARSAVGKLKGKKAITGP